MHMPLDTQMNTPAQQDLLGALWDGELSTEEASKLLSSMDEAALTRQWVALQEVSDALHQPGERLVSAGDDFWAKLQSRLPQQASDQESEQVPEIKPVPVVDVPLRHFPSRSPANHPYWRWMGGVAASITVAVAGWMLWGQSLTRAPEVAAVSVDGGQQVMLRDPQLDALLEAHRDMAGNGALRESTGFLRNATLEWSNP